MKITKSTTLAQILDDPQAQEILAKYNLPCLWCPLARFEVQNLTLGEVGERYGLETEKLLKELNAALGDKKCKS